MERNEVCTYGRRVSPPTLSEGPVEHERAEEKGEGDDGDELPVMEVGVEHSVERVGGDDVQLHAERDHARRGSCSSYPQQERQQLGQFACRIAINAMRGTCC